MSYVIYDLRVTVSGADGDGGTKWNHCFKATTVEQDTSCWAGHKRSGDIFCNWKITGLEKNESSDILMNFKYINNVFLYCTSIIVNKKLLNLNLDFRSTLSERCLN